MFSVIIVSLHYFFCKKIRSFVDDTCCPAHVLVEEYLARDSSPSGRELVLRMIVLEIMLGLALTTAAPNIQPQLWPTIVTREMARVSKR